MCVCVCYVSCVYAIVVDAGCSAVCKKVHAAAEKPQTSTFSILYEDNDYLIADKPAGLLTNGPQSFETMLFEKRGDRRIEAIHRLDRETSGCLLFAKNAKAREAMLPLFQEREIKKVYRALVFGSFSRNIHSVKTPIEGQEAVTLIHLIKSQNEGSELELTIETGRTHQIRKHLAELKHPVIGDKAYQTHSIASSQLRKVSRQMLHAYLLEFKQPLSGQHVRVQAPLPADYAACRRALRLG